MRARGVSPAAAPAASLPTSTSAAPSTMPDELPACVHVVDPLDPVVLLQRHGVEPAYLADRRERRRQRAEALQRGARPRGARRCSRTDSPLRSRTGTTDRAKYPFDHAFAARVWDSQGVGVDVLAGVAVERGDEVGADALRDEAGGRSRSPGPSPTRRRREPIGTRDIDSTPPASTRSSQPRADLLRGDVHRLQTGGAEPVELHAGDRVGQPGGDRRGPGDVAALVADRRDDAEHDVVDAGRVERPGTAARSSWISPTTSEIGLTSCSEPVALPRPRGVRTAS